MTPKVSLAEVMKSLDLFQQEQRDHALEIYGSEPMAEVIALAMGEKAKRDGVFNPETGEIELPHSDPGGVEKE
jgi:hypothetical protein